jgi:ketosteroid isomerase-like protein
MVLISYHWIHEQDGTIPAPLQSKSGVAAGKLHGERPSHAKQDTAMAEKVEDQQAPRMTRRAALAAAAVVPLSVGSAARAEPAAQLAARAAEKNAAFMRGDMQRWSELVQIANDFTLMQPFGGPPSRGFDKSPARLAELSRYFRNGKTSQELVQTYASEDIVVLVTIERQTGEVGGLPEQDWSLRVTEVYRKAGTGWELVHRHADPLVRRVTLEQVSALARGLGANEPVR